MLSGQQIKHWWSDNTSKYVCWLEFSNVHYEILLEWKCHTASYSSLLCSWKKTACAVCCYQRV